MAKRLASESSMQSDLKRAKCEESVFTIVCLIYEYTCVATESEHCGKRYVGQSNDARLD